MPRLPPGFSLQAIPIRAALSEGRTADAETLVAEILRAGSADRVVQQIAAEMIKPPKRARGRRKALPQHWLEIGEQFEWLRADGVKYEDALAQLATKFGYSETHVRTAVATYAEARAASDEASRE